VRIKLRRSFAYAMIISVLAFASVCNAQPILDVVFAAAESERGELFDDFVSELNLTNQQQAQIKKQRNEHLEKSREITDILRQKRHKLKLELEKPKTDKKNIDALVSEINALSEERFRRQIESILSIKDILTPEQFQQLQEKIDSEVKRRRR